MPDFGLSVLQSRFRAKSLELQYKRYEQRILLSKHTNIKCFFTIFLIFFLSLLLYFIAYFCTCFESYWKMYLTESYISKIFLMTVSLNCHLLVRGVREAATPPPPEINGSRIFSSHKIAGNEFWFFFLSSPYFWKILWQPSKNTYRQTLTWYVHISISCLK